MSSRVFNLQEPPNLQKFKELCSRSTDHEAYPLAASIEENIPIYNLAAFSFTDVTLINRLKDEWYDILYSGPGVFVLKGMYPPKDPETAKTLESTNAAFQCIIDREKSTARGDHFAAGGKNDRIWNSFSKHGLEDPFSFVEYYSNPWLMAVCDAWLGPGYRVTAQVNVVKPGGAAQNVHRDYHLGFQTEEGCTRFPRGIHVASQFLTLQGAVAHSDMPLRSGPTRLLPFSQMFEQGFLAYHREEFQDFFRENYVALPLELGDGLFFNPALFHAAGANETDAFHRKANLLQVSSAFGKTMESVDSIPLIQKCWDALKQKYDAEGLSDRVLAFVKAVAEGYPFPTNLDNRPPAPSGMAPESEFDIVLEGLKEGWDEEKVVGELKRIKVLSAPAGS